MTTILTRALSALLLMAAGISPASASDWYEARGARPPAGSRLYVCHGYSCRIVTPVTLSTAEITQVSAPLVPEAADPESERQALSRSVQVFETIIGGRVGTSGDLAGMQFGQGADGQMDCIDEATNTTSLLLMLGELGLLRHHAAGEPAARGFFLDGRYPHATAVLVEEVGGMKWALDSWPGANGEPPLLQPLRAWRRSRGGAPPVKSS